MKAIVIVLRSKRQASPYVVFIGLVMAVFGLVPPPTLGEFDPGSQDGWMSAIDNGSAISAILVSLSIAALGYSWKRRATPGRTRGRAEDFVMYLSLAALFTLLTAWCAVTLSYRGPTEYDVFIKALICAGFPAYVARLLRNQTWESI